MLFLQIDIRASCCDCLCNLWWHCICMCWTTGMILVADLAVIFYKITYLIICTYLFDVLNDVCNERPIAYNLFVTLPRWSHFAMGIGMFYITCMLSWNVWCTNTITVTGKIENQVINVKSFVNLDFRALQLASIAFGSWLIK